MKTRGIYIVLCLLITSISIFNISCKGRKNTEHNNETIQTIGPKFNSDSAYAFTAKQCNFGARIMNSEAHDKCEKWIIKKFKEYACTVKTQKANLKAFDGTTLKATNIIASYNPKAKKRIMLCAHWDSRPWADNDPDSTNHHKPVMAANDGASGVAVMIEIARLINNKHINLGVDFVCFDAEDWGVPQWETNYQDSENSSWALGAQYFANNFPLKIKPQYGILLDMVGGEGAKFYKEGVSKQYALNIVDMVWNAANNAGYSEYFPMADGGMVTDDHLPINQIANIPTIDIISYYPDCEQSSFGPTWHTVNDTMEHIDKNTLQAVGQTIIQVLYSE